MKKTKLLLLCGLALMLLVSAVGVSYARYRIEQTENIAYTAGAPAQVYLGKMGVSANNKPVFDPDALGAWETVGGEAKLEFAVANGTTTKRYAKEDLTFSVRLTGGLGLGSAEAISVTLHIPQEEGQEQTVAGTAMRILPDSPLFNMYGEGWVYRFLTEDGQEYVLPLEGGKLNYVNLYITADTTAITAPSLLRLVVTGAYAPKAD